MDELSKVYVKINSENRITRCEGGYTMGNIDNIDEWVLIDKGAGDKYNLCQSNYFEKPIMTDGGAWRYKLVDGVPMECTEEEIAAQKEALVEPEEPILDIYDELEAAYNEGVNSI